jgi:hypothetical protein
MNEPASRMGTNRPSRQYPGSHSEQSPCLEHQDDAMPLNRSVFELRRINSRAAASTSDTSNMAVILVIIPMATQRLGLSMRSQ